MTHQVYQTRLGDQLKSWQRRKARALPPEWLEAALARHDADRRERPAVRLIDTDFALARQVGTILDAAGRSSEMVADAHVVAVCVPAGGGLVVTADPDDIDELAATVPAARVRTVTL